MLKRYSELFKSLMLVNDLMFLTLAWWLAYLVRFHSNLPFLPEPYTFRHYIIAWLLLLVVYAGVFLALDLYRPRRISTHWREAADLFRGASLAMLIFLGLIFLVREIVLSRFVVVFFWLLSVALFNLSHLLVREALRFLRRRGKNLRHVVVVGSPAETTWLVHKLQWYRHLGLAVVGAHLMGHGESDKKSKGVPLIESRDELVSMVRSGQVDQVFVTFPLQEAARLAEVQGWLGDEPVTVSYVPDLAEFAKLRGRVEEFEDLQIVTLQASPFEGWNAILKRSVDLVFGSLALMCFSPLMALISVGIRLTSPGPILYRQERMGLDGNQFQMLKFRTMVHEAEKSTGPVWATRNDPRVTWLGYWLRCTSLDELPQLMNVLRGEMSLVGPRPERPLLIEQFRKSIPKYMLRHKVKAGMTGWAQINGWRGDTSLEKRIEHDLEYIESWSLGRDLKILALTIFRGFVHRNAG
ncbi:MAG TPA: undecaprenyl-phosphate glucose phosphotransferase [Pyrinomonadaceae bacterium]|jgi:Undecaprenyl-phosphate glucose phosphotransferase|nr:undecaprenyl-phosphate glucose phosphotransferase [Pyrinomonadaceae bacterium]